MEAYPEKMKADAEEVKSVVEHEEIPKEEAAMKRARALKKWHRDQHVDAGRCGQLKERTQGNGGCQKKLAIACGRMTHCVKVARCKEHRRKRQNKDDVAKGTQKG
jgi:hypothetical protein